MVELAIHVALFLAGMAAGVVVLGWRDGLQERQKAAQRKASAQRGASKRKAKALEEATKKQPAVDPQMYGRKANGEGTWAG